jgi:hypothetical protein
MIKLKEICSKLLWYVKQLLPLTYRSRYTQDGKNMFCVFNMWLGKIFNSDTVEIKGAK